MKPGLALQVLVIGNAVPRERATRVDVVFDRSRVGAATLGLSSIGCGWRGSPR